MPDQPGTESTLPSAPVEGTGKPAPPAGSKLHELGGFELLKKVGQGGMGAVFRARQKSLDRIVALKVLPPSIAKNTQFIERFQREARASARFSHPNIVQGIDVGKDTATGLWYFAMEYVDGPNLKEVLAQKKVLPEDRALAIARDMAKALDCIAAHGMVHRDVKPDNILLTQRGEAKLADLGLAKEIADDAAITQSGMAIGTPFYMSPEQVRGLAAEVDIRTDIYALGGTLFHLVTGRPPFDGETSAVIMSLHLTKAAPKAREANPQVSEGCSRLIEWMMQKEKGQRIQTPAELIQQIDRVLKKQPLAGAPGTVSQTARRDPVSRPEQPAARPRLPAWAVAGVAAGVLLAVALILAFSGGKGQQTPLVDKDRPDEGTPGAARKAEPVPAAGRKTEARPAAVGGTLSPALRPPPKKETPQEHFRAIQDWEREHLEAYDESVARYQKAARAAKGAGDAQLEDQIEDAVAAVEKRRATAADAARNAIEEKAKTAAAAGDYDGALAACEALPAAFAAALREGAADRKKALRQEAEAKVKAAVGRIEECSENAEPAEGQKILAEIEALTYAPAKETVAALKARLQDELANVGELRKKKDLRVAAKRLDELLQRFDKAVLEAGDLATAREVAAKAKGDAALAPLEAQARAMGDVAAAFDELARMSQEALTKLKGQKVDLETKTGAVSGTVDKVQDGVVSVRMAREGAVAIKAVKLADLSEEQRKLFSGAVAPQTNAQRTALALTKLAKGKEDLKAAGALLGAAGDFPLAAHYKAVAEQLAVQAAKAAAEGKAAAAWAELEFRGAYAKFSDAEAKALLARLQSFEAAFGKTEYAATIKDKLAELKERAEKFAASNLIKNGSFESGSLDGWDFPEGRENGQCTLVQTDPHDGKYALLWSPRVKGWIGQSLAVEPGATYRFTVWLKLAKGESANGMSRIMFTDGERPTVPVTDFLGTLKTTEWRKVEYTFQPTIARGRLGIWVRPNAPLELLVDDARLVRQTSAAAEAPQNAGAKAR